MAWRIPLGAGQTLGALLVLLLGAAACGPDAAERPDVVLVMIDTLRADRLGVYGYERPTSPHIDALAAEGVVFRRASAPSSWTKPSVASLFTGRLPSEHGAVSFARDLRPELPTLAERMAAAGYRTVGVSANFVHLRAETGLGRGFGHWQTFSVPAETEGGDAIWGDPGNRRAAPGAPAVNEQVRRALAGRDGAEPLFLYVHYMEPHSGFVPPARHRRRFLRDPLPEERGVAGIPSDRVVELAAGRAEAGPVERRRIRDLYDAEIAAADEAVGELLEDLKALRPSRERIVVVLSDHGEELGDHGSWFHGTTLHRELLRIPLIVWDSRGTRGSGPRDEPVDLLDVTATLLAVAGAEPLPAMRGRDLLAPGGLAERGLLAELHPDAPFESHVRPRHQRVALLRWPWKTILDREGEAVLYRLDRDPHERRPLAPAGPETPSGLVEAAREWAEARTADTGDASEAPPLDPEVVEGLRELGYVE